MLFIVKDFLQYLLKFSSQPDGVAMIALRMLIYMRIHEIMNQADKEKIR
jgi:hypothetical protein